MNEERNLKFMVIGAQKGGTTWLHANLSNHPQVDFPPIKELFYFNEVDEHLPSRIDRRLKDQHWLTIKWKKIIKQELPQSLLKGKIAEFLWYTRYLTIPRNLQESSLKRYDNLFTTQTGKLSGDITPNYSILSANTVRAIANFYPDLKIIFSLRNPVERSWSQAKMNLGKLKKRDVREVNTQEIEAYLTDNPSNYQLSDYQSTITNWTSVYNKDQIYFCFYDDLKKDPVAFYRNVLSFLDLEDVYDPSQLKTVVYKGAELSKPPVFEQLLYTKYLDQIRYLAEYFKDHSTNYPRQWLEHAENVLAIKNTH